MLGIEKHLQMNDEWLLSGVEKRGQEAKFDDTNVFRQGPASDRLHQLVDQPGHSNRPNN